uniref:Purple acid phosphatase n=1 Tax=Timema cristinae TaxID=61476 RepID=A0A7R9CDH5_TIMCR|nr:unnamed protein product [Timema cristinae]
MLPVVDRLAMGGRYLSGRRGVARLHGRYDVPLNFQVTRDSVLGLKRHSWMGDKATEMVVTWSTVNDTRHIVEGSWVEYGLDVLNLTANSSYSGTTSFRDQYIHRVKLTDLEPGSVYVYHCGSEPGWSTVFWFKTQPAGQSWSPMLAEEGRVGDEFLRQIESIAGYVPYMTCPGNHEQANNFSDYRNRFSMPGNTEGLWYSFDVGPIHFISISTEVYYFLEYGFELLTRQFNWLKEDLKIAVLAENRALRPWIIVYGHRPMYCSNENTDDCTTNQTQTRTGFMELLGKGLEDMFYNHGVDLEIWAHEHSYERLWPIYNYQIYNGSLMEPYRNPGAPVHVITGSAGCSEFHDPFKSEQPYWSAFRSADYGYNRLKVFNSTHLYMEYVSVEHHGVSIGRSQCTNSQYRSVIRTFTSSSTTIKNYLLITRSLVLQSGNGSRSVASTPVSLATGVAQSLARLSFRPRESLSHSHACQSGHRSRSVTHTLVSLPEMKILIVNVLQFLFFRHACSDSFQPDQIHISYGDKATEMVITWSTGRRTEFSCVEYGLGNLELIESAFKMTPFRKQYIHRVKLTNLKPNSVYAYHCGSEKGWSPVFWFKTRPPGQSWSPALAVYGDLGYHNARSLPHLQNEVQRGFYDAVIHAGDFAYDMNDEEGNVGDKFLRQIESMAGYVPYMTCPGNHEANNNFSDYRNRFSMPGNTEGLWYSFDVGPIHFISISTEVYYFLEYGFELLTRQFNWLKEDLKVCYLLIYIDVMTPQTLKLLRCNNFTSKTLPQKATKSSNRALRPWIIVYGHRPMYCSNKNTDDCTMNQTRTRIGTPDIMKLLINEIHLLIHSDGLEDMFYNHGVDLEIWAHEHSYERLWPIYNYQIYNGSLMEPYRNPGAPVHVITGSAGCDEKHDPFKSKQPYWSAFRSADYGYSRLKVFNSTHLYMEYVSVEHHGVSTGRSQCTNSQYRSTGDSDTRTRERVSSLENDPPYSCVLPNTPPSVHSCRRNGLVQVSVSGPPVSKHSLRSTLQPISKRLALLRSTAEDGEIEVRMFESRRNRFSYYCDGQSSVISDVIDSNPTPTPLGKTEDVTQVGFPHCRLKENSLCYSSPMASLVLTDSSQLTTVDIFKKLPD